MIAIREAGARDAAALAVFRFDFRAGIGDANERREAFIARCAAWMAAQLAGGPWRAWVAESDDAIVGQLWLQVVPKLPNPVGEREHHAYISNLFVAPGSRGGVGTRLLETALAWADAHEVDRVVLWPTPRSRPLYQRYGFTANGDVMERTCR